MILINHLKSSPDPLSDDDDDDSDDEEEEEATTAPRRQKAKIFTIIFAVCESCRILACNPFVGVQQVVGVRRCHQKNLFPSPLCVNKPANFSDPQFIHWESQQVSPNFSDEVWKITLHQTNSVCSFKTCLKKTIYLSFNPHQDQHQMMRPNFRKFVWQILWKMFNTADLVIPSRTNTAIHGLNKQKLVESSFTFKDLIFQTLAS